MSGSGLDWCALPCLPPDIPASPGERKTIAPERVSKGSMQEVWSSSRNTLTTDVG